MPGSVPGSVPGVPGVPVASVAGLEGVLERHLNRVHALVQPMQAEVALVRKHHEALLRKLERDDALLEELKQLRLQRPLPRTNSPAT